MSKPGEGQAGQLRAAAGVPRGSPRIVVDGVALAVSRQGKGPPLVCLHATGHGGGDFTALEAAVSGRFEVIRVDWPGQGRSGEDRKPASAERYAQLLEGVLAELGVRNPIVLGCSIGGATALLYARRQPVRALVLCNSGGLAPVTPFVRRCCGYMAGVFAAGAHGAWWYKAFWSWYYRFLVLPSAAAADQRRRIVDAAYETAPMVAQAWRSFGGSEADLRELAAGLEVPVWVAWATGDKVIPLRQCMPAIRRMRQASLTCFGGGHAAFLERPREFAEGLVKFCAGLSPASLDHPIDKKEQAHVSTNTSTQPASQMSIRSAPSPTRMERIERMLAVVGRLLIAVLFVLAGIAKILNPRPFLDHMTQFGVPTFLLPAVIALEFGGGLAVLIGWRLREAAGALAIFCILTAAIFHHQLGIKAEVTLFLKDLAIAGGLLLTAVSAAENARVKGRVVN
jgi:pimeloyl-ACP methyl ester carboxylesterase/uncharacterized membrane protein YphA (DoxX/SURF4 family)